MWLNILLTIYFNNIFSNFDYSKLENYLNLQKLEIVNEIENNEKNNTIVKKIVNGKESIDVFLYADKAISVDYESGKILYAKNIHEKQAIASISKLMTALVFLDLEKDNLDLDQIITMKKSDEREGAYNHLYRNEQVKLKDLLATSLIVSDNNATIALARISGLSLEDFVKKMNEKAESLGMKNTEFVEPTGLSEKNQSTVYDLVILLKEALKNPLIQELTSQEEYTFRTINTKRLVHLYSTDELFSNLLFSKNGDYKIIGGKTGFIDEAGYCFGAIVENQEGQKIINVVLNSNSIENRFIDFKNLTYWVFDNYIWK